MNILKIIAFKTNIPYIRTKNLECLFFICNDNWPHTNYNASNNFKNTNKERRNCTNRKQIKLKLKKNNL